MINEDRPTVGRHDNRCLNRHGAGRPLCCEVAERADYGSHDAFITGTHKNKLPLHIELVLDLHACVVETDDDGDIRRCEAVGQRRPQKCLYALVQTWFAPSEPDPLTRNVDPLVHRLPEAKSDIQSSVGWCGNVLVVEVGGLRAVGAHYASGLIRVCNTLVEVDATGAVEARSRKNT